jgi:reverse transcriptase-like protein/integrase-like protein/chromodomain-containing protein
LIDSGAEGNFIDANFAQRHHLPITQKKDPTEIKGIDGRILASGLVTEETRLTITCQSGDTGFHSETSLQFEIIRSPIHEIILGLPWLRQHQPRIDWKDLSISFESDYCKKHCEASTTHHKEMPGKPEGMNLDDQWEELIVDQDPKGNDKLPREFQEFEDVFRKANADKLPPHRKHDCTIDLLPGTRPPCSQIYPLSQDEDGLLKEYLEENLQRGFIRRSKSSAGAPIFFVEKERAKAQKENRVPQKRLVVNYKGLDKITEKFRYPLPLMTEIFDRLTTARIFTKIDLRSAYNLIRIREGDEWKTAFRTKYGLYEYLVMPFGLANAPAVFQSFMNEIFDDMIGKFVSIYLDDFLIYSEDRESHCQHVRAVLQRLRENALFAKLEKCQFFVPSIKFLGFKIDENGVASDEDKIQSIEQWPVPENKKQLEVFMGVVNYLRKFVKGFSQIAIPLYKLTHENVPFIWSQECQNAFDTLKRMISSAPVLSHVDQSKPFVVETDASDFALGAVLLQEDRDGDLRPCAYFSHALGPAERNYTTYEKELLAIKAAFEEWRHYLQGGSHPVKVLSDHQGLEQLDKAKVVKQRHARWALFFSRFKFTVTYRPGKDNKLADGLSRRPDYNPSGTEEGTQQTILVPGVVQIASILRAEEPSHIERIKQAYQDDQYFQACINSDSETLQLNNGLAYHDDRLYIPEGPLRLEVLTSCHDAKLAGHYGERKTKELVCRQFFWPNINKSIKEYCEACRTCGRAKSSRHLPYGPLMPLSVPDRPWASIGMDFLTDLPLSEGMTCILVVIDRFTKMAHFIPIAKIPDAEETAKLFLGHIVRLHGLPSEVISDRGTQFVSIFWKRLLDLLGIKQCLSSAYHPQSDGQSERSIQVLEQYLRCFTTYHQDNWMELLPLAEFTFNNTVNASTIMTPFFANSGQHPRFEIITPQNPMVPTVEERLRIVREAQERLTMNIMKAVEDHKKFADRHRSESLQLKTGDLVWLDCRNITTTRPCKKLDWKRLGPFPIRRQINQVSYELELPPSMRIHPVFHVSLLEKVKENQFTSKEQPGPPPMIIEGEEEYLVKEILDSRMVGRNLQYLVDWEGYPPSERCWVAARDVHAPECVTEFHRRYPSKPSLQLTVRR